MDKHAAALEILDNALRHVPFDGWTDAVLTRAAKGAGYAAADAVRVFPRGIADALDFFARETDAAMLRAYAAQQQPAKIRARIALLVRLRLTVLAPHREAVRRAMAMPQYALLRLRATARTADAIWHAAGDSSTDFNWYTKRFLLSGVYASTLLYWLNDDSEAHADSWAFLDRRIGNALQIGQLKQRVTALFT